MHFSRILVCMIFLINVAFLIWFIPPVVSYSSQATDSQETAKLHRQIDAKEALPLVRTNATAALLSRLEGMNFTVTTHEGRLVTTITVSDVKDSLQMLTFRQTILSKAQEGHYEEKYQCAARHADLITSLSSIQLGPENSAKFVVNSQGNSKVFDVSVVMDASGAYINEVERGKEAKEKAEFFGFTFRDFQEAEEFQRIWKSYVEEKARMVGKPSQHSLGPENQPHVNGQITVAGSEPLGIRLNASGEIEKITPGMPGFIAGLRIGDKIVRVNDRPFWSKGTIELLQGLHEQAGSPVKITILRDGKDLIFMLVRKTEGGGLEAPLQQQMSATESPEPQSERRSAFSGNSKATETFVPIDAHNLKEGTLLYKKTSQEPYGIIHSIIGVEVYVATLSSNQPRSGNVAVDLLRLSYRDVKRNFVTKK